MSWKQREPGTKESRRRTRPTADQLGEMGLHHTHGFNCAACGEPVSDHGDPDCVAALNSALKKPPVVELGLLGREEAAAFAEALWVIMHEKWMVLALGKGAVIDSWIDTMDRWGLLEEEE